MSLADDKTAARKSAFARRKLADPIVSGEANDRLTAAIRALPGACVAGYWPIRTEIDPRPTLHALSGTYDLCLPMVVADDTPLVFRRWRPDAAMTANAFGTSIPLDPKELTPDILIVPLAAFDAAGFRLGYGGGFYDRTLEQLRARINITAIGFAYDTQETDHVPREVTDQPLDMIVTESRTLTPV